MENNPFDPKPATIAWLTQLANILDRGETVTPLIYNHKHKISQYCETSEIIGSSILVDMKHPVVFSPPRKLGYQFMIDEALWILSGSNSVPDITQYNSVMANFSDDGKTLFGAYGPKFVDQEIYVVNTLMEDLDSRRAVINIWRENPHKSKDIPCTLNAQFLVRDHHLHAIFNMRSSDAWLGLPYDIFSFTMMAASILSRINNAYKDTHVSLGSLRINMGSSHIYKGSEDGQQNNIKGVVDCLTAITDYHSGHVLLDERFLQDRSLFNTLTGYMETVRDNYNSYEGIFPKLIS